MNIKPILFLLKSDFIDDKIHPSQKFYCPHCAMIEGVLNYYPNLRSSLDIRYVDFDKPRLEIIELLGEAHQSCPVLVIPDKSIYSESFSQFSHYRFTNDKMEIAIPC